MEEAKKRAKFHSEFTKTVRLKLIRISLKESKKRFWCDSQLIKSVRLTLTWVISLKKFCGGVGDPRVEIGDVPRRSVVVLG